MARMNENLNLCEILKNCPYETKLYCTFLGDVIFLSITENTITVRGGYNTYTFFKDGKYDEDGECVIFPSREQRDWSKFKVPIKKFDPKTFKPFDKILVRYDTNRRWDIDLFQRMENNNTITTMIREAKINVIPFNKETEHLISSTDDCSEYYKWWEE